MRISELSQASGVSAATIKFYVRDGLLAEGERNGYNRTEYGEHHLERLRLIRALREVGGLSLAAVQRVLSEIDEPERPLVEVLGAAQQALPSSTESASPQALERIGAVMGERGWQAQPDNPGIMQAALTLDAYTAVGRSDLSRCLPHYAEAAELIAQTDLGLVASTTEDRPRMAETVVIGTVLGDRLLAGLRRIAQEHVSRQRYAAEMDRTSTCYQPAEVADPSPAPRPPEDHESDE